jgi:hypothetical protein
MTIAADAPKVVEVKFELQLADVEQGLALLPRARLSKIFGWFGVIAVILIIGWRWHEGRDPSLLAIVGVFLIAIFVLGRDPTKRIARRIFEALPPDALQVSLQCDEAGVQLMSNDSSTSVAWNEVVRVLDTRASFLIFTSRTNAQIVPKRALQTDQVNDLRQLFGRHVVPQHEPWLTPAIVRRLIVYAALFAAVWAIYYYKRSR